MGGHAVERGILGVHFIGSDLWGMVSDHGGGVVGARLEDS